MPGRDLSTETAQTSKSLHEQPASEVVRHRTPASLPAVPSIVQRVVAHGLHAAPRDFLALQRAYGNRAVRRWLAHQGGAGTVPHAAGASGRVPSVPAQLVVGPVNDPYEQEAERVADTVMRMPAAPAEAAALSAGAPALGPEQALQRAGAADEHGFPVTPDIEARLTSRKGAGALLPPDLRTSLETKLAADFAQVRVHTDQVRHQRVRESRSENC